MPTNLSRPSHRPSTIRRNLFRTLSRTTTSSNPSTTTTTTAAAAAATTATPSTTTTTPSPFDGDDGIIVRNDDGSLGGAGEGQMLMQLVAGIQVGAGSLNGSGSGGIGGSGDRGGYRVGIGGLMEGSGLSKQERLAEIVKRHQGEIVKQLPELLRQKVASLTEDNWMFEAEEDV